MGFEYKTLKVENTPEGIWTLAINRPEALNALNSNVLNEMAEFLRAIGEMDYEHARGLIVTGSGEKSFVAGADIREMSDLSEEQAHAFAERGQAIFHEMNLLKIPVIAAVNGFALGGGLELALACDFIIASENAKMGLPEVSLGLIPGFGGTVRLARAVSMRKAREMIYTGDMITAAEALQCGLVNKVVPQAELLPTCMKVLGKIMERAPMAVATAKKSMNQAWDMEIEEAQRNEARHFGDLFRTEDVREGTKAFTEKRKPQFKGH
jgi:enoyl-CoA hydratase